MERTQRKKQMRNKTKRKRLRRKLILFGVALTIVILGGCRNNAANSSDDGQKGREYLLQLEQMDLGTVEAKIEDHHKKLDLDSIEGGDFKAIYSDTVFMGDSIMESLSFNEILDEHQVIAYMGDTVKKAVNHIPTLEGIQPKNLVMLYGMNDVILFEETASWNSIDKFKEDYKTLLQEIRKSLPNTNIYVQSPLPVTEKATATNPRLTNDNLTRFREAVQQVCEEEGVNYVDISILAGVDSGFHDSDGIHFKVEFYEKWLGYLRGFMSK